jgi:hypothetical protein
MGQYASSLWNSGREGHGEKAGDESDGMTCGTYCGTILGLRDKGRKFSKVPTRYSMINPTDGKIDKSPLTRSG